MAFDRIQVKSLKIHHFRHSRKRVQSGLGVDDYGQDGKSCSAKGHKGRIEKD